ncbi:MAG: T9SS type A sorting domain-containing protein, partial [Bacteroidota bacterium]
KGNISIWPNPVKDILNIDISAFDTVREPEISIYGNDGRLIMTMERTDRIDVSSLPRGIYIIIIKTGNHTLGYNKFIRL